MCTSYFVWHLPPFNLFPMSCLNFNFLNDLHWGVPKNITFKQMIMHICTAMPIWCSCAPPILLWHWPSFNLFPMSCLAWTFLIDHHWHPLKCVQWVVLLGGALGRIFGGSPPFLFVFYRPDRRGNVRQRRMVSSTYKRTLWSIIFS